MLDPFAIPKLFFMSLRFWVKRIGWKPIICSWVISTLGILVYEFVRS